MKTFDKETIKGLLALALLDISSIPNVVITLNKEGIRMERITREEDPADNYMVLTPNFIVVEQQYDGSVNEINFPVLWYNKVTDILGLCDCPGDEFEDE